MTESFRNRPPQARRRDALPLRRMCALVMLLLMAGGLCPGCAGSRQAWLRRDESARLVERAREADERGDEAQAAALLAAAVRKDPKDCETRLQLCSLLVEQGGIAEAETHLAEMLVANPDDPRLYVRMAHLQFAKKDLTTAMRHLTAALELDPKNPEALFLRGKIASRLNRYDEAFDFLYRSLHNEPHNVEVQLEIAELYLKRGHGRQAAPMLRTIVDGEHGTSDHKLLATWKLGQAYAQQERWDEATAMFAEVSKSRILSESEHYEAAYAFYRTGAEPEAQEHCVAVLRSNATHPGARALYTVVSKSRVVVPDE